MAVLELFKNGQIPGYGLEIALLLTFGMDSRGKGSLGCSRFWVLMPGGWWKGWRRFCFGVEGPYS